MTPRDRLARLHFVDTLFHRLTGHDLYLANQMLAAVEAAGAIETSGLGETLEQLHERLLGGAPDAGFAFCDGAADEAAGLLWLRAELLSAVRRNAPFRQATIMVGNMPGADAAPPSPARSRIRAVEKRARQHADDVAQLRELAARRANPRSLVTLLFV